MSTSKSTISSKINFWSKAREEYIKADKPIIYELDLQTPQPKPKIAKFIIMIKKFIEIFKMSMKK